MGGDLCNIALELFNLWYENDTKDTFLRFLRTYFPSFPFLEVVFEFTCLAFDLFNKRIMRIIYFDWVRWTHRGVPWPPNYTCSVFIAMRTR